MASPRYRVTRKCFIAPYLVEKGSVIETDGPGAAYLEPLNAEAEAKMEAWYNKEYPVANALGEITGSYKPNLAKRPATMAQEVTQSVRLVSNPPVKDPKALIAASELQRPLQPDLVAMGESEPAPQPTDDGTLIVSAAPPEKK